MSRSDPLADTGRWDRRDGDSPSQVPTAPLPRNIGRYQVRDVLGQGGFGIVYLAYDEHLKRFVAVKVPHRHLLQEGVEEYRREAQTVASLDHPNIVPVHDVGSTHEFPFFVVSKYIEGTTLRQRMKDAALPFRETARIAAVIARALHYAHTRRVVHRDVKPGNILLGADETPYIVDFGLALRDADSVLSQGYVGTPAYSSPEQARGEGHRIDGRSDIFSLGSVLYEMLCGCKAFPGANRYESLAAVARNEVRPPRQVCSAIPTELERITLKALAKRVAERYGTARDLADELEAYLATSDNAAAPRPREKPGDLEHDTPPDSARDTARPGPIVVPKGLRSFDGHDAEFFVQLLPGPRDRDGLPESIRFWLNRIQDSQSALQCPVGVLYGPSGCGKSSLVKAGILPRLEDNVQAVYIEATRQQTLLALLRAIHKLRPEIPEAFDLTSTLAFIRRRAARGTTPKLLLVIDQFEQWLHHHEAETYEDSELLRALRQCDGSSVQALLLVRDDFWMPISEFMRALETPLVEGQNTMAVCLFDVAHARKVLEAFGRAYGALPAEPAALKPSQQRFLKAAVAGLATEGKVISLDLALLADLLSHRPWEPETLNAYGGLRGVGVRFLEDAFTSETAPADSRMHAAAAQAILKGLLPDPGREIKGHSRTESELRAISGYRRQEDFEELLRLLDYKLRLITPVAQNVVAREDSETSGSSTEKQYQLTHDFLVTAVREWLRRKQATTRRGRAERRLAEVAGLWQAHADERLLPATFDYLQLRLWTAPSQWNDAERRLMQAAGRKLARRWSFIGLCLAVLLAVGWFAGQAWFEQAQRHRAQELVDRVQMADLQEIEKVIGELAPYRFWADPLLERTVQSTSTAPEQSLRSHLALLPTHDEAARPIVEAALKAPVGDLPALCKLLRWRRHEAARAAQQKLNDEGAASTWLAAAALLAQVSGEATLPIKTRRPIAEQLSTQSPLALPAWIELLDPVGSQLREPLTEIYSRTEEGTPSVQAAAALAHFAAADGPQLAELCLQATPAQFTTLFPALEDAAAEATPILQAAVQEQLQPPWPADEAGSTAPVAGDVRQLMEASHGVVHDHFAFCQSLPWRDFDQIASALQKSDYRPVTVRPYRDEELLVAAVWRRDGQQFELVKDASAEEIAEAQQRFRARGWLPRDVARYPVASGEGDANWRWVGLWSPPTVSETGLSGELYVAVREADHRAAWEPLNQRGFVPRCNLKHHDADGQPRYTSIRWDVASAGEYADRWDQLLPEYERADDPWNWAHVDARISDDGSLPSPRVAAVWWRAPGLESQRLLTHDLAEQVSQGRALAEQGYRPASWTVFVGQRDGQTVAASIWQRPVPTDAERERWEQRQGRALVALWRLNRRDNLWATLADQVDPRLASQFVRHAASLSVTAESLARAVMTRPEVGIQRTLLAALARYRATQLSEPIRQELRRWLLEQYASHPDPGLHAHIEVILRRWELAEPAQLEAEGARPIPAPDRDWWVTPSGQAMAIVRGPVELVMGSPRHEAGRDHQKETRRVWRIPRSFAVGRFEVAVTDYLRFRPDFDYPRDYSPTPDCPIQFVAWYDAVRYCRWLSEQEGVDESQMCYPPLDEIGPGMHLPADFLDRTGYRLLTEAEWEYACRALSQTSRHYGHHSALLADYAWTAENSHYRGQPVGQLLPNALGLFDMHGNAMEWCHDKFVHYPNTAASLILEDRSRSLSVSDEDQRATRGGAFLFQPLDARSAQRYGHSVTSRRPYLGFRLARTIAPPDVLPASSQQRLAGQRD